MSTDFIISYYKSLEPIVNELVKINPNTDINVSYGEAIAQLVWSTWDTEKGFSDNNNQVNAQSIKDVTIADRDNGTLSFYQDYVKIFQEGYKIF